jgi:glutaredoxin
MIKLYAFPSCPYCEKVRRAFHKMNFEFEEIDARPGKEANAELVELGGKSQVPFLLDEVNDVKMYESDDIIAYAQQFAA